MIKRLTWFAGGLAAGVAGAEYAKRKVRATAAQLSPRNVAGSAIESVKSKGRDVVDAVREGRRAMREHEEQAIAEREGRLVSLDDHVGPDDQVYVDGKPVEPGRVIVMRPR